MNVSSTAGFVAMSSGYSSIKAWVTNFSESLANELHGTGVTVMALCPGWVHTEFHDRAGISKGGILSWLWLDADKLVRIALRDAERALQGALPDERRRAAGDVQLEAQALAEAQRKLAAGTEQLGDGGSAAGRDDQRRRLAGEQGRVADRIAQLEREVRELARGAGTPDDPLAQAAAELARRRLGQRLQEASRALQDGEQVAAAAGDISRSQRDAAGVLDRVARMAGEATGRRDHATDALAGQLADAREVRDRLRDLEGRIEALARQAEAEARQSGQAGQSGQSGQSGQAAQSGQSDQQAGGSQSKDGQGQGAGGRGDTLQQLQQLQQEYQRELRNAEQMLAQQGEGSGLNRGGRLSTPEGQEFSRSAPGTEAFKQDFARWSSLKEGVASAFDRYEAGLAQRLAEREAAERVTAPLRDEVPDRYSESVIRYYRSLSRRPDTP
ncbi:MAG: SDR family NAD(P)-dependent oxidoreductase [Vicinamibacteria bacterium]